MEVRDLLHSGEDNILSVAPFLDIFVLIKRYHFGNVKNDIFGRRVKKSEPAVREQFRSPLTGVGSASRCYGQCGY